MRAVVFTTLFVFSQLSWGFTFPAEDGIYKGSGQLTRLGDGQKMNYTVVSVIDSVSGTMSTQYKYVSGFDYTLSFQMLDGANGTYAIKVNGIAAGSGYCIGQNCNFAVDYTDAVVGPVKASVSYAIDGETVVTTGHNVNTNTIFQHTADLVH